MYLFVLFCEFCWFGKFSDFCNSKNVVNVKLSSRVVVSPTASVFCLGFFCRARRPAPFS